MSTARKTFAKVMTGLGALIYPKVKTPDTKFNAEGQFQARIRLSAEDSQKLIEQYEAELAKYWPIAKAELEQKVAEAKTGPEKAKAKKALAEMKEADKPYKPAYDDDGNETEEYEFNFKSPASFKGKDGSPVPIKIDVFDASGKKMKVVPEMWSGTTAYVAGELRPFSMPIGVGLSLRLKAVQIIELSQGGGNRDADSYGFGKQEGYEGSDDDEESGFQDRSGDSDDGPSGDEF